MNLYNGHARGMRMIEARLAQDCPVVNWGNKNFAIVPGSAIRKSDLSAGGFTLDADLVFETLVETWQAQLPNVVDANGLKNLIQRTPLGYLGDTYQIAEISIRPGGLQLMVECTSINQKA